jgi:adenylate kinase
VERAAAHQDRRAGAPGRRRRRPGRGRAGRVGGGGAARHDWNYGFVIDGFPRNERQAEFFLEAYDIDGVVVLEMPDEEVSRRVLTRRICSRCGAEQTVTSDPGEPESCEVCGGRLVPRDDDKPEALASRLSDYYEKTRPIIELFERKEVVIRVDATQPVDDVQAEIRRRLGLPPAESNA